MSTSTECPCCSGRDYAACCQPAHLGLQPAKTAEALMRSRYSAFARGLFEYLLKTRHPSKRRLDEFMALKKSAEKIRWTQLRILDSSAGLEEDNVGEVEFVAFYDEAGRAGDRHERSLFRREGGAWFYVDGEPTPRHTAPGRKDRCWCGSGKLYRKCHG